MQCKSSCLELKTAFENLDGTHKLKPNISYFETELTEEIEKNQTHPHYWGRRIMMKRFYLSPTGEEAPESLVDKFENSQMDPSEKMLEFAKGTIVVTEIQVNAKAASSFFRNEFGELSLFPALSTSIFVNNSVTETNAGKASVKLLLRTKNIFSEFLMSLPDGVFLCSEVEMRGNESGRLDVFAAAGFGPSDPETGQIWAISHGGGLVPLTSFEVGTLLKGLTGKDSDMVKPYFQEIRRLMSVKR